MRKDASTSDSNAPKRSEITGALLRLIVALGGMYCSVVFKAPFIGPLAVLASFMVPVGKSRILRLQALALAVAGGFVYVEVTHGTIVAFFFVYSGLCLGAIAQR